MGQIVARIGDTRQEWWHVNGMNPDVDSGDEDVWNGGGNYTFPTVAAATTILSSDANDTAAGTGARTVLVIGLDANLQIVEQTATMNGVTPVALATQLLRVIRARVLTAGSGGSNAGTINVKIGSTVMCAMPFATTLGRTHIGIFTIPAKDVRGRAYTGAWLTGFGSGTADAAATTITRVRFDIRRPGGAWESIGLQSSASGHNYYTDLGVSLPLLAGTDIRAHVLDVTSANTTVHSVFDFLLVK